MAEGAKGRLESTFSLAPEWMMKALLSLLFP